MKVGTTRAMIIIYCKKYWEVERMNENLCNFHYFYNMQFWADINCHMYLTTLMSKFFFYLINLFYFYEIKSTTFKIYNIINFIT